MRGLATLVAMVLAAWIALGKGVRYLVLAQGYLALR